MIITRTPLRLSLGGGGTDLYNWYKKNGSFLITATINKFIYVTISERKILKDFWLSYSTIENEKNKKNIRHSIIRKVLEKYNIKKGLEVHTVSEVPSNSGLGSSGSLTVGFIKALSTFFKRKISNKDLAEEACNVEMVLNNSIKALNLNYLQELNYNDAIEIHHTENSFLITKEGKSCFALELEI
jgi:D-glycero-alpha-D-manno-heptose-7-phosphate kinase